MKLAYIILALALLVPLAFSTPANDEGAQFAGEVNLSMSNLYGLLSYILSF